MSTFSCTRSNLRLILWSSGRSAPRRLRAGPGPGGVTVHRTCSSCYWDSDFQSQADSKCGSDWDSDFIDAELTSSHYEFHFPHAARHHANAIKVPCQWHGPWLLAWPGGGCPPSGDSMIGDQWSPSRHGVQANSDSVFRNARNSWDSDDGSTRVPFYYTVVADFQDLKLVSWILPMGFLKRPINYIWEVGMCYLKYVFVILVYYNKNLWTI